MKGKGCLFTVLGGLFGVLILMAVSYMAMDREKRVLSDETRALIPGEFITLTDGVTHYFLDGPQDGPVVVLVHGFSVASYTWERNVPALTEAGFRVLSYDLFGRGYSDRPEGPYDLDLFVRQLDELLSTLGIDQPVDLAGISMGGYITSAYANRHPDRVRRLVLLAPQSVAIGTDQRIRMVAQPPFSDYLFTVYVLPFEMVEKKGEFQAFGLPDTWRENYLDMMQYVGFRAALISTLRTLQGDPFEEYRRTGSLDLPVLLLWGDKDQTNPIGNALDVLEAIPQAELHTISGARHASPYERPEEVNPLIIEFLRR
jgi:pimeloyl-ACP methyl ester carboxylesterase